jgi:iron complex outermembrane receptor protein
VGLAGAMVTVTEIDTGASVTVVSGEGGEFRLPDLEPGEYTLKGTLRGYHPATARPITVRGGRPSRVELSLSSATFDDTVTVAAASPHDTLEAAELRESAARDVGEALARMPGVWKIRRGGIANDVVLRGFKEDNVTVLIDGARVAGACPNRMDPPAFHLDFAEVDRIELAPTTGRIAVQGSLGGVVNVITRKPETGLNAAVSMVGGSFDMLNPSATISYGRDRIAVLAGVSYRRSRPFEDGFGKRFIDSANYIEAAADADAYAVTSAWTRLYLQPAPSHDLTFSYARQEADDVLYPALMMDAVYDDTDRLVLGYRYSREAGGLRELRSTIYATEVDHWMTDSLRTTSGAAPRGWGMGTNAATRFVGASVEADVASLTLGVESYLRGWDAWTEMAGMEYRRQFSIPDVEVEAVGLSLRWRREVARHTTLEIGGRVDRVATAADPDKANTDLYFAYQGIRDTSRSDTVPSYSLRIVQQFADSLSVSASLSRTTRAPDPRERYFGLKRKGFDWVGNPVLDPPQATGAELGVTWSVGAGVITAKVWRDRVGDFITLYSQPRVHDVPGVMNAVAQSYANVDADLRGVSLEATAAVSSRLFLSGNLSYVQGTKDPDPNRGILSENLAEMPPLTARLAVRWQNQRLFGEVEGVAAASQDRVDADLNEDPTSGYEIINLKAGVSFGAWRLQVNLENLLDHGYREHLSYLRNPFRSGTMVNEPGRSATLTLGWNARLDGS